VWNGEVLSDTESDTAVRAMDYVTGSFSIRVAVPLKSPNNVANNVDCNVFLKAGDDFEFHTLSPWGGRYLLANPARSPRDPALEKRKAALAKATATFKAQQESGDLNTDTKDDTGVIPLGVGDVYTSDIKVPHFGESYRNLREMCKRYHAVAATAGNTGAHPDTLFRYLVDPAASGGMIGAMFNSFRLFRGPMNFTLQLLVVNPQGSNTYPGRLTGYLTYNPQPALFSSGSLNGLGNSIGYSNPPASLLNLPLIRFSDTHVAEFQCYYPGIYHSMLAIQNFENVDQYFGNQYIDYDILADVHDYYGTTVSPFAFFSTLTMAFGDETRLGLFLGFPQLIKSASVYPNPGS